MICKRCSSKNNVKHGFLKGERRYQCKDCGFQFVPTSKRKPVRVYKIGDNHVYVAKVFMRGQITVPVEIRRLLQVKEGDKVLFTHNDNGEIVLCNILQTEALPPIYISRKITGKGQLAIPVKIRRLLKIEMGDTTFFTHNENGELIIGVTSNTEELPCENTLHSML